MPTARRAPAALLLRRGGERLLFDCAEGTQRQLQRSAVGLPEIEEIFLTHLHADHVLGLPGHAQDVRPARARGAGAHRPRPARRARPVRQAQAVPRAAPVPADGRRARARGRAGARRLPYRGVRGRPRRRRDRVRPRRGGAAGPLRRRGRGCARRPRGPGARDAPGRRAGDARGRARDHARRRPRPGAARPEGHDHRRHRRVAERRPGRIPLRSPRPRGDLRGRRDRSRARDAPFDRRGCGAGGEARRGSPARAHARLAAVRRLGAAARGAGVLRRHGRAARLRPRRDPVPRARRAAAREGRRRRRRREVVSSSRRWHG